MFQKSAAKQLGLTKPYQILRPGVDKKNINTDSYKTKSKLFTVTYIGTLIEHNGIDVLLDSIKLRKDENIRYRIFGTGPMEKEVRNYSQKDCRVYFGGLINQHEVKKEFSKSDLLLNIRDPYDYVCKFAFPSKLIEYMASGVPVILTNLSFEKNILDCLYVLKDNDPETLNNKISFVKNDSEKNKQLIINKSIKYVSKNNRWECVASDFIRSLTVFRKH